LVCCANVSAMWTKDWSAFDEECCDVSTDCDHDVENHPRQCVRQVSRHRQWQWQVVSWPISQGVVSDEDPLLTFRVFVLRVEGSSFAFSFRFFCFFLTEEASFLCKIITHTIIPITDIFGLRSKALKRDQGQSHSCKISLHNMSMLSKRSWTCINQLYAKPLSKWLITWCSKQQHLSNQSNLSWVDPSKTTSLMENHAAGFLQARCPSGHQPTVKKHQRSNTNQQETQLSTHLLLQTVRVRKSVTVAGLSHTDRSCTVSCVRWFQQLNRCPTECGATPHIWSDMLLVMQALYVFKSRQWSECNWASVVWTDSGSRLSSGEISDRKAPRTLFSTKFGFTSTTVWLWRVRKQDRYVSTSVTHSSEWHNLALSVPFMFLAGAGRVARWWHTLVISDTGIESSRYQCSNSRSHRLV